MTSHGGMKCRVCQGGGNVQVSVSQRWLALGGSSEQCCGFPAPEREGRLCAMPADEDAEEHRGY